MLAELALVALLTDAQPVAVSGPGAVHDTVYVVQVPQRAMTLKPARIGPDPTPNLVIGGVLGTAAIVLIAHGLSNPSHALVEGGGQYYVQDSTSKEVYVGIGAAVFAIAAFATAGHP